MPPCLRICIIAVTLAASGASALAAAPDGAGVAVATGFVDLSRGGTPAPPPATANPPVQTRYLDMTAGGMRELALPQPAGGSTLRPQFFDLTSGAAPERFGEDLPTELHSISVTGQSDPGDPYEDSNRSRFEAHVALHRNIIDPVETVYVEGVPEPARAGLHNFLTNLETPSVFVNDVLQGRMDGAAATLTRFVVNSTVGIGGILDVGAHIGLRYRDNDFGRTLAEYGVGDRPYLLVPVIGPSNARDLTGKVVDFALDPLHYIALPGGIATSISHAGAHEVDKRSFDVGALDALDRGEADPYLAEKTRARARRSAETGSSAGPR